MDFGILDTGELTTLAKKIISANVAVVAAYGAYGAMNAEITGIFDDIEPAADSRGLVFG